MLWTPYFIIFHMMWYTCISYRCTCVYVLYHMTVPSLSMCFSHLCMGVCVCAFGNGRAKARKLYFQRCLNVTRKILSYSNLPNYTVQGRCLYCSNMRNIPKPAFHRTWQNLASSWQQRDLSPRLPGLHGLRHCHPPAAPSSTTTA